MSSAKRESDVVDLNGVQVRVIEDADKWTKSGLVGFSGFHFGGHFGGMRFHSHRFGYGR